MESQHEGELTKARHWEVLGYLQEILHPVGEAKLSIKSEGKKTLTILGELRVSCVVSFVFVSAPCAAPTRLIFSSNHAKPCRGGQCMRGAGGHAAQAVHGV